MRYLKIGIPFFIVSLLLTTYIGYQDEGNFLNYSSFWQYLKTDAVYDNIYDPGRHVYTILFIGLMIFTFYLLRQFKKIKDQLALRIISSIVLFPIVDFPIIGAFWLILTYNA